MSYVVRQPVCWQRP